MQVGSDEWYKLVVPEDLQGESHDIMLYYNDDTFLRLCTPGPHGEMKLHPLSACSMCMLSYPTTGLAMYFYLEGFEDLSGTCTQIELENCSQETHALPAPQQHRYSNHCFMMYVGMFNCLSVCHDHYRWFNAIIDNLQSLCLSVCLAGLW